MKLSIVSVLLAAIALSRPPELRAAQVDVAKNGVRSSSSSRLAAGSTLPAGEAISTGRSARAQVSLGNRGSVMRAGSKTEAVLQNENSLALRQGILLASSGRGALGREGVSVETPETRTTVKGTMLVAYQPQSYIKVTCIEGEATVRLKALLGEFVRLREGQMVIINPAERRLPQSVEVDLRELIRTSALLGPDFSPLAAAPRLDRATERQAKVVDRGDVIPTPLILTGAGLEVSLQTNTSVSRQPEHAPPPPRGPEQPRPGPPGADESPGHRPPPDGGGNGGNGGGTGPEYIIDGTTVFSGQETPRLQTPGFPVVEAIRDSSFDPSVWSFHNLDAGRGPELLMRGEVLVPATSGGGDAYVAAGTLQIGDGSATVIANDGNLFLSAAGGPLNVTNAQIVNAGEASTKLHMNSGDAVRIHQSVIEQRAGVEAVAPAVDVQQSRIDGGSEAVLLVSSGSGITISNSSQLHSMATSLGIALESNGGRIAVHDSELTAPHILIEGFSTTGDTLVELRNAVLNGDVIRARGYASGGGDALIVNGSRVNAAEMIRFYAEGTSRLRFQGNVELNLSSDNAHAVLAGRTVQVDEGGQVNVRGHAQVYRDIDNYNRTGFGALRATGQLSELPFDRRPPF